MTKYTSIVFTCFQYRGWEGFGGAGVLTDHIINIPAPAGHNDTQITFRTTNSYKSRENFRPIGEHYLENVALQVIVLVVVNLSEYV